MPLSLDQFVQQLTGSGLLTDEELPAFRNASTASDAEQLARELVRKKKLTAFQAQQAYAGKAKTLVLGNYVVLDKLGQGGMGLVLKAEHRRMKRVVALKVLSPGVTKSKDLVARFHREVQAAARLEHPNIVSAYDADEANGTHFFVMQYVDGQDLSSLVKSKGTLAVEQAVGCVLQAAKGLQFAHAQGVIHRDIKPANLLLDGKGVVKILDMGLARIEGDTGAQAEITNTGAVMGTVDYMAPEQARNTKTADARSDIYSLGITLWYLLVGKPAYDGQTLTERLLAHQTDPIPSLCAARPDVPAAVDAVFRKLVAKRPEDRYQSMTDVIAALEACQRGESPNAPSLVSAASDDSQFNAFLAGLAKTDSGPKGSATVRTSAPTVPVVTDEFAVTQTSAIPESATSPQVQVGADTPPKLRAASSRFGLFFGGIGTAGCLFILSLLWSWTNGGGNARIPESSPQSERADIDQTPVSPTVQATGNYALEFDGRMGGVEIPWDEALAAETPVSIEFWYSTPADLDRDLPVFEFFAGTTIVDSAIRSFQTGHVIQGFHRSSLGVTMVDLPLTPDTATFDLHHIALMWDGSKLTMCRDGTQFATGRSIFQDPVHIERQHRELALGTFTPVIENFSLEPRLYRGRLDEIRISHGVRYRNPFSPARTFSPDADTLALYHCDENGGSQLVDASGHERHGTIYNPKWVMVPGPSSLPVRSPPTDSTPPFAVAPFTADEAKAHQAAWAKHLGVPVEYTNSIGMKFCLVPPGEFLMGGPQAELEAQAALRAGKGWVERFLSAGPQHSVRLTQPYYLATEEVTQQHYQTVTGNNPAKFTPTGSRRHEVGTQATERFPVESVSWFDAIEFCNQLALREGLSAGNSRIGEDVTLRFSANYRLPTEAEWEHACRAGATTTYYFGDDHRLLPEYAWYADNSGDVLEDFFTRSVTPELQPTYLPRSGELRCRPHPVGGKLPNAWGFYDLCGNVAEWCQDWYDAKYYQIAAGENPTGPDKGTERVNRGGFWLNTRCIWSYYRMGDKPEAALDGVGFRPVLSVDAVRRLLPSTGKPAANRVQLEFDGVDDYIDVPKLRLDGLETFTIEARIKWRGANDKATVIAALGEPLFALDIEPDGKLVGYLLRNRRASFHGGERLTKDRWYDLAATVSGEQVALFLDGRRLTLDSTLPSPLPDGALPPPRDRFMIGAGQAWDVPKPIYPFPGSLAVLHVSQGIRYQSDYPPPTAYSPDADTLALYKFNDGQGTVLGDASPHKRHGQINGATWKTAPLTQAAADPDRAFAEWLVKQTGPASIFVQIGNEFLTIQAGETLPERPFVVRNVDLKNGELATSEDIERLLACRHLEEVGLIEHPLEDAGIARLAQLNQAKVLALSSTKVGTSAFGPLQQVPGLCSVQLIGRRIDDGLASLVDWPRLRRLDIYQPPAELDLSRLAEMKSLRWVHLGTHLPVDLPALEQIQRKHGNLRITYVEPGIRRTVGTDPTHAAAKRLMEQGVLCQGRHFKAADNPQPFQPTDLDDGWAWYVEVARIPATVRLTPADREALQHVMFYHLEVLGQPDLDDWIEQLTAHEELATLNLSECGLTDQGLAKLETLVSLRQLTVFRTQVSREGVARFQRAVPACSVSADFGTFPADYAAP